MKHTGKIFLQTVYAYTIDSAISFAFSVPQSSSVNFKANGIAAPIPLPVVTCPSVTAASCTTCAQSSPSSKDGYAHAFLPFKIPSSLKILGAAQIAARYFFFLSNSPIRFRRPSCSFRFSVPGIPPGSTSISPSEKSVSSNSRSASTMILCAPLICFCPVIEIVSTSILALRIISTTVNPSISSNPSAKKMYTFKLLPPYFTFSFFSAFALL